MGEEEYYATLIRLINRREEMAEEDYHNKE